MNFNSRSCIPSRYPAPLSGTHDHDHCHRRWHRTVAGTRASGGHTTTDRHPHGSHAATEGVHTSAAFAAVPASRSTHTPATTRDELRPRAWRAFIRPEGFRHSPCRVILVRNV